MSDFTRYLRFFKEESLHQKRKKKLNKKGKNNKNEQVSR